MIIDLFIIGSLVLYAILGRISGSFRQLVHWGGLALARAIAKPLALIMTLALAPDLGIPPVGARVGLSVLCFCTIYVVGTSILKLFLKKLPQHRRITFIDQVGGLLLGMGQGAVIIFVLVSGAVFFESPPARAHGRPQGMFRNSLIVGLVRRHNMFGLQPFPVLARLEKLIQAARDPRSARALAGDPGLQQLLNDPGLKSSLQDEELADAIRAGDWSTLQKDPRIAALLKDPRITGSMSDPLEYDVEEER
ncbi:MAG: CvpA family protein [Elusimicrobia bacterium]|nr:CvpA family protein [Elusimicrobiota bacterium]